MTTEKVDVFTKFDKGNSIPYYCDFSYLEGVPDGVEFQIIKAGGENDYWLEGEGFGMKGFYGNGRICVAKKYITNIYL